MKVYLVYLLIASLSFVLGIACAGQVPIPKQIPDAISAACSLYKNHEADVEKLQAYVTAHWNDKKPDGSDLIPADVKAALLAINKDLPAIKAGGTDLCDAASGLSTLQAANGHKIDWNVVLADVIKIVDVALQAKQQGVI